MKIKNVLTSLGFTKPIIIVEAYEGILTDKDGKLYNLCPEPEMLQ